MINLMHGDCIHYMQLIPDGSVDMIMCDLPYGTTACGWDAVIPFDLLWPEYKRIVKPNGAIVLTANQPFTTIMISSNMADFRYQWIWRKTNASGFANAKKRPLKVYEDVCVFSAKPTLYFPQGLIDLEKPKVRKAKVGDTVGETGFYDGYEQTKTNYPKNVLDIPSETNTVHPTQKPVALMEYLIRTYTNPGDTVLDNCMGSGTTGVACMNTDRKFIGIEQSPEYFPIAEQRIYQAYADRWS